MISSNYCLNKKRQTIQNISFFVSFVQYESKQETLERCRPCLWNIAVSQGRRPLGRSEWDRNVVKTHPVVQNPRVCGCIYLSLCHIYTLYLKVVCSVPGLSLEGSLRRPPHPFPSVSQFKKRLLGSSWLTRKLYCSPLSFGAGPLPPAHPPSAPMNTHVCYKRCLHIINTSCKVAFLYRKMELCGVFFLLLF